MSESYPLEGGVNLPDGFLQGLLVLMGQVAALGSLLLRGEDLNKEVDDGEETEAVDHAGRRHSHHPDTQTSSV